MHIAVPLFMDTVKISFGKPEFTWGRVVATHAFIQALAKSSDFEKLTIIVPTKPDIQLLESTLLKDLPGSAAVVAYSQVPEYLGEHPIDVLHILEPSMHIGGHIRNFLSRKPFVITGLTLSLGNAHFIEWAVQNSANGIGPNDCLVCVTDAAKSVVDSCHAHLVKSQPGFSAPGTHVIPLGISVSFFRDRKPVDRTRFNLSEDEFVILSLARFNPMFKMDFMPLLNLAAMVRERSSRRVKFVFAGASDDGSYVNLLRDAAAKAGLNDTIEFVLDPSDDQKAQLYGVADVFISFIDNVQESMGLTVVEALASGLPVVASDWNGYKSLIGDGVNGFLIPTKTLPPDDTWEPLLSLQLDSIAHLFGAQTTAVDLEAACETLVNLSDDGMLVSTMRKNAAASAEEYDWENVISRFASLWKRLVADQKWPDEDVGIGKRSSALRFVRDFYTYPTTHLSPDDMFVVSPLGERLLNREVSIQPYGQLEEVLDMSLMSEILRACQGENSLAKFTETIHAGSGADSHAIAVNTMWLYKYGFLASV